MYFNIEINISDYTVLNVKKWIYWCLSIIELKNARWNIETQSVSVTQTNQLMLYREIMAVCSEIHTKHINTLCGQNVELLKVKLELHIVTAGLKRVQSASTNPTTPVWLPDTKGDALDRRHLVSICEVTLLTLNPWKCDMLLSD